MHCAFLGQPRYHSQWHCNNKLNEKLGTKSLEVVKEGGREMCHKLDLFGQMEAELDDSTLEMSM